jgi:hypothetical protein
MMDGDGHCWQCWGLMSTEGGEKRGSGLAGQHQALVSNTVMLVDG